ncbi:hypothetical protein ACLB2K_055353 [Fragaria x ananassa]
MLEEVFGARHVPNNNECVLVAVNNEEGVSAVNNEGAAQELPIPVEVNWGRKRRMMRYHSLAHDIYPNANLVDVDDEGEEVEVQQ